MTFEQTLKRIKEIHNSVAYEAEAVELVKLLSQNVGNILALASVAKAMRERENISIGDDNYDELSSAATKYDSLMKGE